MTTVRSSSPAKHVIGERNPTIQYIERAAVRVIVRDSDRNIAVIKAHKENYYKLPGGGIEAEEDHAEASEREVLEETGCHIKVFGPCVAVTEEYRNDLHQISYCYTALVIDKLGKPELTKDELDDRLAHEWLPYQQAVEAIATIEPTSQLGLFIKERDTYLLTAAKEWGR